MLHGAHRVDRQLQRQLAVGRATQLVVDDAERAVLAAGRSDRLCRAAQCAVSRASVLNLELAVERMLQQPLDDRRLPFGLDLKHRFGQTLVGGRTEKTRALHGGFVLGQLREQRLDHFAENLARLRQILRRNAADVPGGSTPRRTSGTLRGRRCRALSDSAWLRLRDLPRRLKHALGKESGTGTGDSARAS